MRGTAGPWLTRLVMDTLRTTGYAALMTARPPVDDPGGVEVTGGGYARRKLDWDTLDSLSVANAAPITWGSLPGCTIVGVAVMTALVGGEVIVWCPLDVAEVIRAGSQWTLGAHDIFVEVR